MAAPRGAVLESDTFRERDELRRRVTDWLDLPLTILAVVMVGLIVLELAADLSPPWLARVEQLGLAIWVVFGAVFLFEIALAPSKGRYLRENWLTALSVILPAFRVVRVFRAARLLRGLRLFRVVTALNRATRALQGLASYARYGYVAVITALISVTGAAAAYYFERGVGGELGTFGDAFWWAITSLTTVNSGTDPVTFEGRTIGILLRVLGLGLSGYLTATIAVYLIGVRPGERETIAALREELARSNEALARERSRS